MGKFNEKNPKIIKLNTEQLDDLKNLFSECFENDSYYVKMFPRSLTRKKRIGVVFLNTLLYCINNDGAYGIFNDKKLIAFFLLFNYHRTKSTHTEQFNEIFKINSREKKLPHKKKIHDKIDCLGTDVIFLLSMGVSKDFRRKGIAGKFIDFAIENYPNNYLAGDVSSALSMAIYKKRKFECTKIEDDYFLVIRKPEHNLSQLFFSPEEKINVAIPDKNYLTEIAFTDTPAVSQKKIKGYSIAACGKLEKYFIKSPGSACTALIYQLTYAQLLMYQRYINLSCYQEEYIQLKDNSRCLIYYCISEKNQNEKKLWNENLKNMIITREKEWAIIPDIQILVPVEYASIEKIKNNSKFFDPQIYAFLHFLDYRTYYEAGTPKGTKKNDHFKFENRIERYYLGKKTFAVTKESTIETYGNIGETIGAPSEMDIIISIDKSSNCGVFSIITQSTPFLISHLLDNIIRNQLFIRNNDGTATNIYDYIEEKYDIHKRGTSKSILSIPQKKCCLPNSHIASLLMSETIYSSEEEFGVVIDDEIIDITESETGMGLYDRAFVCVYTNTFIQFCNHFNASVKTRMDEEAITFFYIELLAFEEAAIQIIDHNIIKCLSETRSVTPAKFLRQTLKIHQQYARTIEFWDIQVNYPSSKKSVLMIRNAFKINDLLERMKRDAEELKVVFDAQRDIMDRAEASFLNYIVLFLTMIQSFSIILKMIFPESCTADSDPTNLLVSLIVMLLILFAYHILKRKVGKNARAGREATNFRNNSPQNE